MLQVYPIKVVQGYTSSDSFLLVLLEPKSKQCVPIVIGGIETQNIIVALEHIATKRPMTHHLIADIMKQCSLELNQVVINRFDEGVFHASLYVDDGMTEHHIDSRPSDAITLALTTDCPIMIEHDVVEETAVPLQTLFGNTAVTDDEECDKQQLTLDDLEEMLKQYEAAEEYEKAEEIMKQIDKMKGACDE